MKLGAVFPQAEIGNDPVVIKDFVQAVEDLGYDYLSVYEHVNGVNSGWSGAWKTPYNYQHASHAPLVLLGYLTGLTQRLKLLTSIQVFPSRQTVLVATQAAEMDVLSGGRLRLGVTVGWDSPECQAGGADCYTHGRRIEEQIAVLRALWTKPLVTFKGEHHTIEEFGLNPLPVQRPIPIWISGMADVVLWHAARLGDGWFAPTLPIPRAKELVIKLRGYLEKVGREPGDLRIRCRVRMSMSSVWPEYVQLWRELGATHIELGTLGADLKTPQEHIEALRRFKAKVSRSRF